MYVPEPRKQRRFAFEVGKVYEQSVFGGDGSHYFVRCVKNDNDNVIVEEVVRNADGQFVPNGKKYSGQVKRIKVGYDEDEIDQLVIGSHQDVWGKDRVTIIDSVTSLFCTDRMKHKSFEVGKSYRCWNGQSIEVTKCTENEVWFAYNGKNYHKKTGWDRHEDDEFEQCVKFKGCTFSA